MHRHEQITVQINHLTIHLVYANLITERGLADSRICGNAVACPLQVALDVDDFDCPSL